MLSMELTYSIDINNLLGCVSSIFNVETGDLRKGITMRFKRVFQIFRKWIVKRLLY